MGNIKNTKIHLAWTLEQEINNMILNDVLSISVLGNGTMHFVQEQDLWSDFLLKEIYR